LRAEPGQALLDVLDVQKLIDHLVDALVPILRVLLKRFAEHVPIGMGQFVEFRLGGEVFHQHLRHRGALKRHLAHQHFIEDHPQGVNVDAA
jgi:hypothetical protein